MEIGGKGRGGREGSLQLGVDHTLKKERKKRVNQVYLLAVALSPFILAKQSGSVDWQSSDAVD